jgi:hypothetical protein
MPRLTGKCVAGVRLDMKERGFAVVATPRFFDDDLFLRLRRSRTVLPTHSKRWWKYPQLARYACWLEDLLGKSLPEEVLSLAKLEFRHEPAGSVDGEADRLHADGSYLRSVCTLFGPTTVYRAGEAERSVPEGQTLLMTAQDRARAVGMPCTLHRRPGAGPERAVVVCTLELCQEQPEQAHVYRQVAPRHRPRKQF